MQPTWLTFDRDYRMLAVAGGYEQVHRDAIGKVVWDQWPDAKERFMPVYELAWQAGYAYRVVPYRDMPVEVHANAVNDELRVVLTPLTLDGLRDTLEHFDSACCP